MSTIGSPIKGVEHSGRSNTGCRAHTILTRSGSSRAQRVEVSSVVEALAALTRAIARHGFSHFMARVDSLARIVAFYIGTLKGIGPVWQRTAVDFATRRLPSPYIPPRIIALRCSTGAIRRAPAATGRPRLETLPSCPTRCTSCQRWTPSMLTGQDPDLRIRKRRFRDP